MKAVVQRVKRTSLYCEDKLISEIPFGLVVFLGVAKDDKIESADYLAKKIAALRVFEDENKKMNLSVNNVGGEILAVSQFTLLADLSHGNRPGFSFAEAPERAQAIYVHFIDELKKNGAVVKGGVFGGDMKIHQINDGPVTIVYEV